MEIFLEKKCGIFNITLIVTLLPTKSKYLFPYYVILIDYVYDIYKAYLYTASENHIELGFCSHRKKTISGRIYAMLILKVDGACPDRYLYQ